MTTPKQTIFLKDVRANQLDKLIDSLSQRLPEDQMDYIKANIKLDRYPLFKAFKKAFGSTIKKPQFNANVERAKVEIANVKYKKIVKNFTEPKVEKVANVRWIPEQGKWGVIFKRLGKNTNLGRFHDHDEAVKVALEYRKKLA